MPSNSEQFEALLARIRDDFLAELPHRCLKIEQALLDLSKQPSDLDTFNELFRDVHSLKGSGGTHGLSLISAICHQLENRISFAEQTQQFDQAFLKNSLLLSDLIKQAGELYASNAKDFSQIEQRLETVKKQSLRNRKSVMIVESSKVMRQMVQQTLENLNTDINAIDDGLLALQRLLHEKFDLLILSGEIKSLNAKALIAAIREGRNVNSKTKIILISSNLDALFPYQNSIMFVSKDQKMASNLEACARSALGFD